MLKIKLKPTGKIHQRSFRVVIAPDRSKVNGNFVDDLGFYTPQTNTIQIDAEKLAKWQKNGAQITVGVDKLLHPEKYPRVKKKKEVKEETPIAPKVEEKKEEVKEEIKAEEVKVEETKVEEVKEETPKQE